MESTATGKATTTYEKPQVATFTEEELLAAIEGCGATGPSQGSTGDIGGPAI